MTTMIFSYDLERHMEKGPHTNTFRFRSETAAQPHALQVNDRLACGREVISIPQDLGGGIVEVELNQWDPAARFLESRRLRVPALLPLQLMGEAPGVNPEDLQVGQILETGDTILSEPKIMPSDKRRVRLHIPGGDTGRHVSVSRDAMLAVTDLTLPVDASTPFGAFVVEKLHGLPLDPLQPTS